MTEQNRPYPEGLAFDEAWNQRKRAEAMEASKEAWKEACRYLHAVIIEGSKRGRPIDLIGTADYKRIVQMIHKAEESELIG